MSRKSWWPKKGTKAYKDRCRKMSLRLKKEWADTDLRAKRTAGRNKPDAIAKQRATIKATLKDPKIRERISNGNRKTKSDPEVRKAMSLAAKRALSDPRIRKKMSLAAKKRRSDPEIKRKYAKIRASQSTSGESVLEHKLRKALELPHMDVPKFGAAWDGAWPEKKLLLEIQGCYWHGCKKCGFGNQNRIRQRDKAKRLLAETNGWQVVYIWEHEAKKIVQNPRRWLRNLT